MNLISAAVDIGSHTARLLGAKVFSENGKLCLIPELTRRDYIFIASEMSSDKVIEKSSISRTITTIKNYTDLALSYNASQVNGIVTGVIREAVNRDDFVRQLNHIDGFNCRIISGEEEAILTLKGVANSLEMPPDFILFDLGGGSTEFIFSGKDSTPKVISLPLGCSTLTKRFLEKDEKGKNVFSKINKYIMEIMHRETGAYSSKNLIGTGGTVASVAAICKNIRLDHINYKSLHKQEISFFEVDSLYSRVINTSTTQMINNMHIEEARAKVLPAGLSILRYIMLYMKAESLTVSMSGLLEGIILSNTEKNSYEY